jgi:diguanylate cyclase (GGDEF)-like protein
MNGEKLQPKLDELQKEISIYNTLTDLYKSLISATPFVEIASSILLDARDLTQSQDGYVAAIGPETRDFHFHAISDLLGNLWQIEMDNPQTLPKTAHDGQHDVYPNPALWGHSLLDRKPFLSNSPTQFDSAGEPTEKSKQIKNFLSVPVKSGRKLVGEIGVANSIHEYDKKDLQVLQRLADFFADSLQHQKNIEEQMKARQVAEALQAAGIALSSTLEFNMVLDLILEQASRVLTFDSAGVLLVQGDIATVLACRGFKNNDALIGYKIALVNDHPNYKVVKTHSTVIEKDVQKFPGFRVPPFDSIKSWMGIPLMTHDQLTGILTLDSKIPAHFSEEDGRVASAFATQVALALENSRLYTEARRRITEMSVINEISNSLSTKLNLDEFLKLVDAQINRLIEAQFLLIAAYEPVIDEWFAVYANDTKNEFVNIRHKTSQGITGYVISTGKPLHLRTRADVNEFLHKTSRINVGPMPKTFMGAPMIVAGETIGAIVAENYDHEGFYNLEDFALFSTISAQVAVAFENARLFAKTQQMAITDTLTGLYNRRHFYFLAGNEFERAIRYRKPLTAIMIDLDHFKQVNDTCGHITGDLVLQMVTQSCVHTLRKVDIMGRFGGDEFVIILPETSEENGFKTAERLRQKIAMTEVETTSGIVKITASLGLAVLEQGHKNLETLLDCADKALYAAKKARNRVKVYVNPSLR